MMNTERKNSLAAAGFLLPSFFGFAIFSIFPMIISLCISLTNWNGLTALTLFGDPGAFFREYFTGLRNFSAIFSSAEIYQTLGNNIYFTVLYLPLMLLTSISAALILNKNLHGVSFFRVVYYIPVLSSWVAGAMIWKWVLSPDYGVISAALAIVGIKGPAWLQNPLWAMPGVVLASVWKDMGFYGLMFLAGLKSIDPGYYEAAEIDGAGKGRQLWHITLPLLSPVIFFVVIISMIGAFQLFPQVMIMMSPDTAGPQGSTMVIMERIYSYAFRYFEMGYASAISWILFALIFILTFIQMKFQDKWVTYDT
ncbi:MAG: sugar ABC transporter permease [Treponema sp.]|jgi:multiple sugar transport system permease protein|nr:sugar ABC transporter permease [Treponema sp.]